ncbi:pyridoxamine 5'-phosphate oxidase family protein [Glycomyces buryatensis]|uniref:Pyridoxamine 5'-phosphate oxidase family protein n=1 Tax=Glycomyces buryatensis TaxID=2570927 RepID=A0A4S8QGQ9_9ACTN|nr:pyridoxamine 5'-phosphate oxidase family protein [Glycomyces buryatensis]THV43580.1 pyridoxamine 5'-phosphate oxidase family protein [Glycomyces buryatensis]
MAAIFTQTDRTTPMRSKEKIDYTKAPAYQVLDEALFCDVAFVGRDGAPRVLPTFPVRVGNTVYFHGSTGSSLGLGAAGDGLPVCLTATIVDGLVFSKSWFHHSMNYRSVVVHGEARVVTDEDERWNAMRALIERMSLGRSERSREPSAKELSAVAIMVLSLEEVSVKARSGPPVEEPDDEPITHFNNGVAEVKTVITGRL